MKRRILFLGLSIMLGATGSAIHASGQQNEGSGIPKCCHMNTTICTKIGPALFFGPKSYEVPCP